MKLWAGYCLFQPYKCL